MTARSLLCLLLLTIPYLTRLGQMWLNNIFLWNILKETPYPRHPKHHKEVYFEAVTVSLVNVRCIVHQTLSWSLHKMLLSSRCISAYSWFSSEVTAAMLVYRSIDHFTVVCLVAWPLNESEAGVDLVLIETLLLFICKFLLISMRTASLTREKQGGFYQNKVTSSLTFIQRPDNEAHNCKMVYCQVCVVWC